MKEIRLEHINENNSVRVKCYECSATGISSVHDELGVVCKKCLGKGFTSYKLNGVSLYEDTANEIYYIVKDDTIIDSLDVFKSIKLRDDVSYVILNTSLPLLYEYMLLESTDNMLVAYDDFVKGVLPLPIERITCPLELTEVYKARRKFENDCPVNKYHTCNTYYNAEDCWKLFYDGAKSIEDKQSVLRRKLK